MAAADYTSLVQSLYVSYFGRPADSFGLDNFAKQLDALKAPTDAIGLAAAYAKGGTLKTLVDSFGTSAESVTLYGTDTLAFVTAIYRNAFNREPDFDGLKFWTNAINSGSLSKGNAALAIVANAAKNTTDQGIADAKLIAAKIEVAKNFTTSIDTGAELAAYNGDAAAATARDMLRAVTVNTIAATYQASVDTTLATLVQNANPGVKLALTGDIDTLVGTDANDSFTATIDTTGTPLTPFDSINGGAGIDTIRFLDTATVAGNAFNPVVPGVTVQNVESVSVLTTGGINLNTKAWTGVTDINANAIGTAAASITAADSTNVTLNSATTGVTTITGGKAVNVALSGAATTVGVTGAGLTTVSVKGGNGITIDNQDAAAVAGKGTTLTAVTLDGITGGAAVKGASLTDVSLKNIVSANAVAVTNTTAAHTLNIKASAAGYDATGAAVAGVTVQDDVATAVTVAANGGKSNVGVSGLLATKATITGADKLALNVTGLVKLATIDASANAGGVTLTGIASTATSITTGSGNDMFTVTAATVKDDTTTTADETVNATVSAGAGNDIVTIATTGNGKVVVGTGAGNDTVIITSRGTEILNISLGDGNDTLTAVAAINGTDVIDAGAGIDNLALKLVGSANVGAFSNFDIFDTAGLNKTLDVDILATKNTVTEFVASGDVGAGAILTNVGAGVGFRVTADIGTTNAQTLTQKVGGALTVTVDADETGTADVGPETVGAAVHATNATSLKAVFDTSYLASIATEPTAGDNVTTLNLTGDAATSLEIVSGGALANNKLVYTDGAATDSLTSATVTGAQALDLTFVGAGKLATVDATAQTGGLTFATGSLAAGGTVKLGSGVDTITVSDSATIQAIAGFEKAAAVSVSAVAADATAKAAAIADADTLVLAGVSVAGDAAVTGGTIANGVLTFTGAGPSTLDAAIVLADTAFAALDTAVVFNYLNDSYVFIQAGAADVVVKLTGVTGIANFTEAGATTDHFFIV